VSADGGYGVTDARIRVRNLNTGAIIHTLTGHPEEVSAIALSPDGEIIASGSRDARVKLWSLSTGKLLRTF
jgi:WD40 repeat protein